MAIVYILYIYDTEAYSPSVLLKFQIEWDVEDSMEFGCKISQL